MVLGGLKQLAAGEVGSDNSSAATGDSGRGPSEDSTAPAAADDAGISISCVYCRRLDNNLFLLTHLCDQGRQFPQELGRVLSQYPLPPPSSPLPFSPFSVRHSC